MGNRGMPQPAHKTVMARRNRSEWAGCRRASRGLQLRRLFALWSHRPICTGAPVADGLRFKRWTSSGHLQRLPSADGIGIAPWSPHPQSKPALHLRGRTTPRFKQPHQLAEGLRQRCIACAAHRPWRRSLSMQQRHLETTSRSGLHCASLRLKPNGSVADIAGITNPSGNVLGLMPHPERACDPATGGTDGRSMLKALLN